MPSSSNSGDSSELERSSPLCPSSQKQKDGLCRLCYLGVYLLVQYTRHFFRLPLLPYAGFLLFSVLMFPLFSPQATAPFFSCPFCPDQFQRLWYLIWYFPSWGQRPHIRYHLECHCQGCKLQNNTATALSSKRLSWGATGMTQWVRVLTV